MVSTQKPVAFGYHPYSVRGGTADVARSFGGTKVGSFDVGDVVDDSPQVIAGMVLGALIAMFALKALGFRFAMGIGK